MNSIDKPVKPTKNLITRGSANYHFPHFYRHGSNPKVSLISFLDWCKEVIPKGAMDVFLELKENQYEDDGNEVWIEVSWNKEIKNKYFDKEMKKYKKQLDKWKKQNVKS